MSQQNTDHLASGSNQLPAEHDDSVAPMDERTLQALKGSIEKWRAIENDTGVDRGWVNCPLCLIFNNPSDINLECQGCPVYEKTGRQGCADTPYEDWDDDASPPHRTELARAEREFLESLLPRATDGESSAGSLDSTTTK